MPPFSHSEIQSPRDGASAQVAKTYEPRFASASPLQAPPATECGTPDASVSARNSRGRSVRGPAVSTARRPVRPRSANAVTVRPSADDAPISCVVSQPRNTTPPRTSDAALTKVPYRSEGSGRMQAMTRDATFVGAAATVKDHPPANGTTDRRTSPRDRSMSKTSSDFLQTRDAGKTAVPPLSCARTNGAERPTYSRPSSSRTDCRLPFESKTRLGPPVVDSKRMDVAVPVKAAHTSANVLKMILRCLMDVYCNGTQEHIQSRNTTGDSATRRYDKILA